MREHATRTCKARINRYGRVREKGVGHMASYAQSLRGACTAVNGNRLEGIVNKISKRLYVGAKRTEASLPQFTVGDGCQVLTPQLEAS